VSANGPRPTGVHLSLSLRRWSAAALGLLSLALLGTTFLLAAACHSQAILRENAILLSWPLFTTLGLLIVFYRPHNRIGWLCLTVGVAGASTETATYYVACGLLGGIALPRVDLAAWFSYAIAPIALLLPMFILLPLVFPDGHFLSPRWRRATLFIVVVIAVAQIAVALQPDFRHDNGFGTSYPLDNPLGRLPATWSSLGARAVNLAAIAGALLAVTSMVVRFRRSRGDERQQLKWFAYFLGTVVALQLLFFELLGPLLVSAAPGRAIIAPLEAGYGLTVSVVFIGFPVMIGITVFKYRLYDIDIIIRRTLQYTIVSALLALVYAGSVTMIQRFMTTITGARSPLAIVVSTLFIAALFNPVRRRVQTFIDRRFYREKVDAQRALAQFASTARKEVSMELLTAELTGVIQETMQPETVSIWLKPVPSAADRQESA
jgi:hypothetical protein